MKKFIGYLLISIPFILLTVTPLCWNMVFWECCSFYIGTGLIFLCIVYGVKLLE